MADVDRIGSRAGRRWRRVLVVAAAVAAVVMPAATIPGEAHAAPFGTILVVPSLKDCGGRTLVRHVGCGAAYTAAFLASRKVGSVVRETVLVTPTSGGVWRSSTTGGICGFYRIGNRALGAHHCDRTTFIEPISDAEFLTSDVAAISVLIHESAHGLQERAGLDPVALTLSGNHRALFPLENSGDCWSGVGIAWSIRTGRLPGGSERVAAAMFGAIGSPRAKMGHGTGAERVDAFYSGFRRGASACNAILGRHAYPD